VVVVVAHPRLEPGGAAGRLDPPGQARAGQRAEHVVDRLGGDRVEALPDLAGDLLDLEVAALGQHVEHRHAGPRHAQAGRPQHLLTRRHLSMTTR
jgi:hypothetical protein